MAKPTGYGGRDYPDFGASVTAGRTMQLSDMSELAVRLGGLNWFDRLGTVLMQEGFQNGLVNWEHNSYPAGAFAVPSARYYSTVPYSARLKTTDDNGSYSGLNRAFPFPYISSFGVELHFKAVGTFKHLYWWLKFYDGSFKHNVLVKINYADDKIELLDDVGGYQAIDDLNIQVGANSPFHVVKCTVDLANSRYVRLMLDNRDYNVRDVIIAKTANTTTPYLYMLVLLTPETETAQTVWIDNIIFTIDEPGV